MAHQLVDFRRVFFVDADAEGFGKRLRDAVAADVRVVVGLFTAWGVAQLLAFVVLRLVVQKGDAVHRGRRRQKTEAVGDFIKGHVIHIWPGGDVAFAGVG